MKKESTFGFTFAVLLTVTQATIFGNGPRLPCSLNKIAPNQRDRQNQESSRTFGHFFGQESDLDEDDDDDCNEGDQQFLIDNRPNQFTQDNFFGNWFPNMFGRPPNFSQRPPQYYPNPVPNRPVPSRPKPTRPPQGGYFGNNNNYDSQNNVYPSNNIKPVHENTQETYQQPSYYPSVVGGNVNQIVGVSAGNVRPRPGVSVRPRPDVNGRPRPDVSVRPRPEFSAGNVRPRPGSRLDSPNPPRNGIIGSFVDLLFK